MGRRRGLRPRRAEHPRIWAVKRPEEARLKRNFCFQMGETSAGKQLNADGNSLQRSGQKDGRTQINHHQGSLRTLGGGGGGCSPGGEAGLQSPDGVSGPVLGGQPSQCGH